MVLFLCAIKRYSFLDHDAKYARNMMQFLTYTYAPLLKIGAKRV